MKINTPLFIDRNLQEAFLSDGYVVLRKCFNEEISKLREVVYSCEPAVGKDFFYSLMSYGYAKNVDIGLRINRVLQSFYQDTFADYKVRNESFLIKPANTKEELLLHQDWSYTDIRNDASATLWIPLVDTDEQTGAMFFLNKSHLKFPAFISASLPTLRISGSLFPGNAITTVGTHVGDAILFNPQIFHGSYPNVTISHRGVVTANVFHPFSPYVLPHRLPTGETFLVDLEDDDFMRDLEGFSVGNVPYRDRCTKPLNIAGAISLASIVQTYK